jgi:hypothetical protein
MDKKLRMIQLQVSKERLDFQREQADKKVTSDDAIEGQGVVLDRNALLQQILNKPAEQNSTK